MHPSCRLHILIYLFISLVAASLTTVPSPAGEGVTISYREPEPWACRTAFATQRQVTGWVTIPGKYPTNLFFWFIAARENKTATPFSVWLNGGPGSSSLLGLFTGNGPCSVAETGVGTYATSARQWGWDRASHMLFIDQPNQVGFSYDVATPGTLNFANASIVTPPMAKTGSMLSNGTFPSFDARNMPDSTQVAADAVWHLLQAFFGIFSDYAAPGPSPIGVNLFAESYGGTYGPVFASSWRKRSSANDNAIPIHLESLGIVNGCVDPLIEAQYYPYMSSNNTYGLKLIGPREVQLALDKYRAENGCADLVTRCQTAVAKRDNATADGKPSDPTVDEFIDKLCRLARARCVNGQQAPYFQAGRSAYDIAHPLRDPAPGGTYIEYLNTAAVQAAIGAVTNFSASNQVTNLAFARTADSYRRPLVPVLADLLLKGTRIALVYGDRDYICNWMGGDAVANAIAKAAGGVYANEYPSSGYTPIAVNESYVGGVARQFGNLSFTRIYQAGHMPTLSQPETTFQVFARIVLGTSLSTGQPIDLETYATPGDPLDRGRSKQKVPSMPTPTCWPRSINESCEDVQRSIALAGRGVTINGVLYGKSSDWPLYHHVQTASASMGDVSSSTPLATKTATATDGESSVAMTGIFIATAIPVDEDGEGVASVVVVGARMWLVVLGVMLAMF